MSIQDKFKQLSKGLKTWDALYTPVLILSVVYTQLFLLFYGRSRRKSTMGRMINLKVWLLYNFLDMLAITAFGRLSGFSIKALEHDNFEAVSLQNTFWASVILFFLGGPDTVTILSTGEIELWSRHLITLTTQGAIICYILLMSWAGSGFSILTLLMLISGTIKYGERVWTIRSRTRAFTKGFARPYVCTILDLADLSISSTDAAAAGASLPNRKLELKEETKLVVEAYICFQTMKPHIPGHLVPRGPSIKEGGKSPEHVFKQIGIELGFMYDTLFNKVGTVFTTLGSTVRVVTLSCLLFVLVVLLLGRNPESNEPFGAIGFFILTMVLLLGAILLDIAGLGIQLVSDWAVVWACKHQSMLSNVVIYLHEHLLSKKQRWSELVGQLSLLNVCLKYKKPAVLNGMVRVACGWGTLLSICFSSPAGIVKPKIKELIIDQLTERSQNMMNYSQKVGAWTLGKFNCKELEWTLPKNNYLEQQQLQQQGFQRTMDLEFGETIVLWHIATDICYLELEGKQPSEDSKAAKMLSDYMMYLLIICPQTLPFCNTDGNFLKTCVDIEEFLEDVTESAGSGKPSHAEACKQLWQQLGGRSGNNMTFKRVYKLASGLMEKAKENTWEITTSMWVEMLCYAAMRCDVAYHAQGLRHGGEFLTHVWLLLMHFGVYGDHLGRIIPPDLQPAAKDAAKIFNAAIQYRV